MRDSSSLSHHLRKEDSSSTSIENFMLVMERLGISTVVVFLHWPPDSAAHSGLKEN